MHRLLVIGDVMEDVVVRPEGGLVLGSDRRAKIVVRLGGSPATQALRAAAEGLSVDFVARVGANDADRLSRRFAELGVTPHFVGDQSAGSGRLVALVDPSGERSFFTDRGANEHLSSGDVPSALLRSASFVLLSGYSVVCDTTRAMMRAVLGASAPPPVGFDPASAGFIRELGRDRFLGASAGAYAIFPNEEEAEALTGETSLDEQLSALGERFPLVVIKRGPRGAAARLEGRVVEAAAAPLGATDTTGAGDAFVAGFVAQHVRGASLETALRHAVAAGSAMVRTRGADWTSPVSAPI